ncbi:MAG TPA: DsbA family protein [Longimicrobium sp.]|nr:DsbA family protein [Longimicrobium sp.]
MKSFIANTVTATLVACALTVTGLAVRREIAPPPAPLLAGVEPPRAVPQWRSFVKGDRIGPADPRVTIVEFSDFQCPYCRTMAARLKAIRDRHPNDVAVVYRHFPLSYHPHAKAAARASWCAGRQGRFEAYHDALFAHQDSLGTIAWTLLASRAGVSDSVGFARCLSNADPVAEIELDIADARRLGVSGTPTLLINDQLLKSVPPGVLEALVESELRAARK